MHADTGRTVAACIFFADLSMTEFFCKNGVDRQRDTVLKVDTDNTMKRNSRIYEAFRELPVGVRQQWNRFELASE